MILLKVAMFLGVKVHSGVEFKSLLDPSGGQGWKAQVVPDTSPVAAYEFDVMIGADGKKYSLPGFVAKEFKPTLAIAITANFVYHRTQREARIQELSGVMYFCRQDFFKSLSAKHGIDLENVVYYKDEHHYFVMTIKKQSLLNKGALKEVGDCHTLAYRHVCDNKNHPIVNVICCSKCTIVLSSVQNFDDVDKLLSHGNINKDVIKQLVKDVAVFATDGQLEMESLEFEKNHRGEDDVAIFDFTSLFAAENAARIIERQGKKLLTCLVGDTLIEVSDLNVVMYIFISLAYGIINTYVCTYIHIQQDSLLLVLVDSNLFFVVR